MRIFVEVGLRSEYADGLVKVEGIDGLSLLQDLGRRETGIYRLAFGELGHLVAVEAKVEHGVPLEVAGAHVGRIELDLKTLVRNGSDVVPCTRITHHGRHLYLIEQVGGLLLIIIERKVDAVLKEAHVEGDVPRVGLLPAKVGIGTGSGSVTRTGDTCP